MILFNIILNFKISNLKSEYTKNTFFLKKSLLEFVLFDVTIFKNSFQKKHDHLGYLVNAY